MPAIEPFEAPKSHKTHTKRSEPVYIQEKPTAYTATDPPVRSLEMRALDSLAECWLSTAETLEGAFDERGAALYRHLAAELQEALREAADEVLTLSEAASESGYSVSRLRHMLASGDLPQAGVKGRPRVRRSDLPSKPQKNGQPTTDLEQEVNAVLRHIS